MMINHESIFYLMSILLAAFSALINAECANGTQIVEHFLESTANSSTHSYQRFIGAPYQAEKAVAVSLGLRLQRMNLIAEANFLEVDAFITRKWFDERLKFDDIHPCHTSISAGSHLNMWSPQLTAINANGEFFDDKSKLVIIQSNGSVLHIQRFNAQIPCLTDALSYPFGNTICTLILQTFSESIQLEWDEHIASKPFATMQPIEQVGDLRVLHISFLHNTTVRSTTMSNMFGEAIVEIHFARTTQKIILLFYLPSLIIVFISWLSLVLGPMAITRMIMNIGAFILLILHYLSNMADLPRTTGITAIDIWKIGTMVFVVATLFELVVVTCMASVGRSRRLTRCCRRLPSSKHRRYSMEPLYEELNDLRQRKTRITCGCCRYSALLVDFFSMICFATAFIAFVVLYFSSASDMVANLNDFQTEHLSNSDN